MVIVITHSELKTKEQYQQHREQFSKDVLIVGFFAKENAFYKVCGRLLYCIVILLRLSDAASSHRPLRAPLNQTVTTLPLLMRSQIFAIQALPSKLVNPLCQQGANTIFPPVTSSCTSPSSSRTSSSFQSTNTTVAQTRATSRHGSSPSRTCIAIINALVDGFSQPRSCWSAHP